MGTPAWAAVLPELDDPDQGGLELLGDEFLGDCFLVAVVLPDCGDVHGEDLLDLLVEFLGLLLQVLVGALVLDVGAIFEVVPLGGFPPVAYIMHDLPSLWTARSSKCPAECSLAFLTLVCSSILTVTSWPTAMPSSESSSFQICA